MPRFRIFLVALLFVIIFTVLIENALEYRIKTSDGVESSLWTILANSLWRKSRISSSTTSTKINFINSSTSSKRNFYTNPKKLTTTLLTTKLKDSNWKNEPNCEWLGRTKNFTRFAIGGFQIDKPEHLTFEYFDLYKYCIVEFGGKKWDDFPRLKIAGCQVDFKWPYYPRDLEGGKITCCAKDCSNAESHVNNFCPRLNFRATWSCSIRWVIQYRSSQIKITYFGDDVVEVGYLDLTFVKNENSSFAIFDYTGMETMSRFARYEIETLMNYNLVSVVLRDNNQSYSYDVPFSNKSAQTLIKDTNCHANGIYIHPFQNYC